jgi:hypothetical protein
LCLRPLPVKPFLILKSGVGFMRILDIAVIMNSSILNKTVIEMIE